MSTLNLFNGLRSLLFFNDQSIETETQYLTPDLQPVAQFGETPYGIVETNIYPNQYGVVRYGASLWKARGYISCYIQQGTQVRILGRIGLLLVVDSEKGFIADRPFHS